MLFNTTDCTPLWVIRDPGKQLMLGGVHAHPSSGVIYVNGRMHSHTPSIRQKHIAYLPQHVQLFEGTVLDNIRYTNTHLTDVEVHNILRHYNIHRVLGYPSE